MTDYVMINGELYHFNPFHDKLGRFASSSGGSRVYVFVNNQNADGDGNKKQKQKNQNQNQQNQSQTQNQSQGNDKNNDKKKKENPTQTALNKAADVSTGAVNLRDKIRRNEANRQAAAMDLSSISDEELNKQINRMNLEKRYRDAKAEDIRRGKDHVDELLEYGAAVLGMAASAAAIAAAIKQMSKKE